MIVQSDIDKIDVLEILRNYDLNPKVSVTGNANFCCPFHGEKNPSCGMKINTGLWKCFACGLAGNLTSFVAEFEKLTLEEAEKKIRQRWIEKIPDVTSLVETVQKIMSHKEDEYEQDAIYPRWILSKYTNEVSYMSSRGLTPQTCEFFNVVYDPNTKYQGFPCYNEKKQLVGVTGRNTQNGEPRYFPLIRFKKSHFIYNFEKINKDESVIAVEGEINVMAMHQKGYPNTIAFLGAGISTYQIELMKNSGIKNLIIFFDTDSAGKHGTKLLYQNLWLYMKIKIIQDHEGDAADLSKDQIDILIKNAEEITVKL
jgi:DNA primase